MTCLWSLSVLWARQVWFQKLDKEYYDLWAYWRIVFLFANCPRRRSPSLCWAVRVLLRLDRVGTMPRNHGNHVVPSASLDYHFLPTGKVGKNGEGKLLVIGDHKYRVKVQTASGRRYWECSQRHCSAKAITSGAKLISYVEEHVHTGAGAASSKARGAAKPITAPLAAAAAVTTNGGCESKEDGGLPSYALACGVGERGGPMNEAKANCAFSSELGLLQIASRPAPPCPHCPHGFFSSSGLSWCPHFGFVRTKSFEQLRTWQLFSIRMFIRRTERRVHCVRF